MNRGTRLQAVFTVHHNRIGLTARRPVFVNYPKDACRHAGPMLPVETGSPGRHERKVVVDPERQDPRPHNHDYYEICVIQTGLAAHHTDTGYEELPEGTVIVMAPGMVHAIYGLRALKQANIYYLPEWVADDLTAYLEEPGLVPLFLGRALFRQPLLAHVPRFALNPDEMKEVIREIEDIRRETGQPVPSLAFLKSSLLKLLIRLSRAYVHTSSVSGDLPFRNEVQQGLERIEQSILQAEVLSVGQLAERVGLSANHFGTLFKKATGWPPMEYYQHRRAQHAGRLLLDPQRSVTEIAHVLGYCDAAHLHHMFVRYQGMSPTRYRRLYAPRAHGEGKAPH